MLKSTYIGMLQLRNDYDQLYQAHSAEQTSVSRAHSSESLGGA